MAVILSALWNRFWVWFEGLTDAKRGVLGPLLLMAVGAICGGVWYLVLLGWSWLVTPPPEPAFNVVLGPTVIVADRKSAARGAVHWIVPGGSSGQTRIPVCATIHLGIVNVRPVPSTVTKVSNEIRDRDRNWIALTRLPTVPNTYVMNFRGLIQSDATQYLDREILRIDALEPFRSVAGWTFWEYPAGAQVDIGNVVLRVTVEDTASTAYTTEELRTEGDPTLKGVPAFYQLVYGDEERDISKMAVEFDSP